MSIVSLPRPSGIAFDLDGTLIDSRGTIARSCNAALVAVGRSPLPPSTIAGFVGDGARVLLSRALGAAPEDGNAVDPDLLERTYEAWLAAYVADPTLGTSWMPGAVDLLDLCANARLPLALVTNKARAATDAVLLAFDATTRFRSVIGGGDGPLKPSPEPIVRAARDLHIEVGDLWVVGDGVQDVRAARAAGAFSVAVRGGFSDDDALIHAEPHVIVASLAEVGALIERASAS